MENIAFLIPTCLTLALIVVGVWLLYASIKGFLLKRKHLAHAERVEGVVVSIERKQIGTSTVERGYSTATYGNYLVVSFTRASGEQVTFTSETGDSTTRRRGRTTETKYEMGQKVTALYDPDGVLKPMLGDAVWSTEIFMALGGAVFLVGAVFIIVIFGSKIIDALPF